MPNGTGIELLDKIRERDPVLPVVLFVTGFTDITVEAAFRKGAEAVFAKPYNRRMLTHAVFQSLSPKNDSWSHRPWRGDVAVPIAIFKENQMTEARVLNLSRTGIFVHTEGPLPKVDERISFKIMNNSNVMIVIEGEGIVKWVRSEGELPKGFGLQFENITEESRIKISELLNFLKTGQYLPQN